MGMFFSNTAYARETAPEGMNSSHLTGTGNSPGSGTEKALLPQNAGSSRGGTSRRSTRLDFRL